MCQTSPLLLLLVWWSDNFFSITLERITCFIKMAHTLIQSSSVGEGAQGFAVMWFCANVYSNLRYCGFVRLSGL